MIGVVASRFNDFITERLVKGCIEELEKEGEKFKVLWVPGTSEIPYGISKFYEEGNYKGFIAVGCIIKGETKHWEFLANSVITNIIRFSMERVIPITHAILTVDNLEQAINRSGGKLGNKGREAAKALLELLKSP